MRWVRWRATLVSMSSNSFCDLFTSESALATSLSDFAISAAYLAIPHVLAFFVLRRKELPFLPVFWLFAAFILSCGIGHAIEATIFWHPWYRLSGVVKLITAIVSWATVIVLIPVIPRALAWPKLADDNRTLKSEIAERQTTQQRLEESYHELESFANNAVDREDRIIELKLEVNLLLSELGREAKYSCEADPE